MVQVLFVAILVQGEAGARVVSVDEARVGMESRIASGLGCADGQSQQYQWQCWPWCATQRIDALVAITAPVRDPA